MPKPNTSHTRTVQYPPGAIPAMPVEPVHKSCKNCECWVPTFDFFQEKSKEGAILKETATGFCTRYPPILLDSSKLTKHGPITRFALTLETTFCHEHKLISAK